MNSKKIFRPLTALLLALALAASSCVPARPPVPPKTQLEVRQMQTRTYDNRSGDTRKIMKAVINVLQDEGYIIKNADKELGFITAEMSEDVENPWNSGFSMAFGGQQARYQKNALQECSVNVTEVGREVKVRAIFQKKIFDNFGSVAAVLKSEDAAAYQDFFSKVDKGIFLEKQNLRD